jgi:plastocyanin
MMRRVCLFALLVITVGSGVGFYAVSAAGAPTADGKLFATVGPSFSILLRDATGATVTHLDPGTYEIEIDDRSVEHNFHLIGPGPVSAGTEIDFVGIRTITVTLVNGQYTFVCDVHSYDMIGQFTVGTASPPPPTTTTTLPKLVATVGPGYTISLTRNGRKVTTLKPRRYTVVVRDRSAIHNFHLIGPSVNKATGIAFVGTRTWTVRLTVGLHRFRCDPHRLMTRMRGSFTVRR